MANQGAGMMTCPSPMTRAPMAHKERPIIFSGPMVRAILEGRKSMTRRVVKQAHLPLVTNLLGTLLADEWDQRPFPYGKPGDRLWVREGIDGLCGCDSTYLSDGERLVDSHPDKWNIWREGADRRLPCKTIPAIHMPRWASRITLEISEVRVERVQDISHRDALAEGVSYDVSKPDGSPVASFQKLWNSIVWVISFKRVQP